jgi:hypothetical protein
MPDNVTPPGLTKLVATDEIGGNLTYASGTDLYRLS